MKTVLFAGLLALTVIVLSGCIEPIACTEEARLCPDGTNVTRNPDLNCEFNPCPNASSPVLEFSFGECDQSISPYNTEEHGIKETKWIDNTTLEVKAIVSINCAEEIESGDFEIVGKNIVLVYKSPLCEEICADCMCAHEIKYNFSNLEKKDYTFELKRDESVEKCAAEGQEFSDTLDCCTGLVKAVSTCEKCKEEGEPLAFDGIPCCEGLKAVDGFCVKKEQIKECAEEGENVSVVFKDQYPEKCCNGLIDWPSGMDTRISIAGTCYETGMTAGNPVGTCLNCGNGVCESIENVCNCPEDCSGGEE